MESAQVASQGGWWGDGMGSRGIAIAISISISILTRQAQACAALGEEAE